MTDLAELSIRGRLATPADADWDQARQAWNLAADQRPSAVAFVEDAADVAAVIRFAADHDLRVTAQGTGHGALALAPLDDAILIRTSGMREVSVDAGARTARLGAGVLSAELGAAAQTEGLCGMPGSAVDVGVVGYTLGGGFSWLSRRYGFACNRVHAVELVTAAGEEIRVDAESEPELFWALRGGGGGFGVVTALELDLLPIAEVYAGAVVYPAELGADAVRAYRDWTESAPDEVTSIVRFLHLPPIPEIPEPLRDRPLLTIDAAFIGDPAHGERLIAPLRELGEPIMDNFGQIPTAGLTRIHMDPEQPVPGLGDHRLLRELPDEAIDAFVGLAGADSGSPLLLAELRHMGGALGRPAKGGGALSSIDAAFAMLAIGSPMTPEAATAIPPHLDRLHAGMEPWAAEGLFFNFVDNPCDVDAILPPDACRRLAAVKRRWDPDDRILANHAVSLAAP